MVPFHSLNTNVTEKHGNVIEYLLEKKKEKERKKILYTLLQ